MEGWTTIRYLHAQGKSVRAIARELSIARNTVRAALRSENPPHYERPKRSNPQLEPFADQIERMLFQQHFIGSRILRELRPLGYKGGETALYEYLRALKATSASSRLTERFETPPAQQGQFDWSPYTIALGGSTVKVIVFGLTLAFSRRKFYWPALDETQSSVFESIEAALQHFGGSPKELLVDNARVFVDNANPVNFQWNRHFLELCGHYSIKPVACQPYRARTKGKVERPFYYLEQQFIKGGVWENFDAFARALTAFTADDLDKRVHATTGEPPIERFEAERALLTPLPARPFVGTNEEMRKVSWDCLISFGGSRYSVPWEYAAKHVWVRPSQGIGLVVRGQKGIEIARHRIAAQKGMTVINPVHYEGLRRGQAKTRAVLEESFLRLFPEHGWFAEALFIQHKPNGAAHLRAIMALAEVYSHEALRTAFAAAKEYNTYSHRFIRGLLESSGTSRQAAPTPANSSRPPSEVGADLVVYQRILEGIR